MATLRVLDTSPVEDEELWSQQEGERRSICGVQALPRHDEAQPERARCEHG